MENEFLDWMVKLYHKKFRAKIGFTVDTQKIWPRQREAETLLKKVELLIPGSTQSYDSVNDCIKDLPIKEKLIKKFENDCKRRRDELKITKTRGKNTLLLSLQVSNSKSTNALLFC